MYRRVQSGPNWSDRSCTYRNSDAACNLRSKSGVDCHHPDLGNEVPRAFISLSSIKKGCKWITRMITSMTITSTQMKVLACGLVYYDRYGSGTGHVATGGKGAVIHMLWYLPFCLGAAIEYCDHRRSLVDQQGAGDRQKGPQGPCRREGGTSRPPPPLPSSPAPRWPTP